MEHEACIQNSPPEAEAIATLVGDLLQQQVSRDGNTLPLTLEDVLIVAPYNMQVNTLRRRLPAGARIGTIDELRI